MVTETPIDLTDPDVVAVNAFRRGYTQEQAVDAVSSALCEAVGCDGFQCDRSHKQAARIVARVWQQEAETEGATT